MQNRENFSRKDMMVEDHKQVAESEDSDIDVRDGKDFDEADCESDYEDQIDAIRGMKRRKREDAARTENRRIIPSKFLPSSNKKMSACTGCRLVLNREKWRKLE